MNLISGDRLGPYEILSPLGAGGMGEVYRARDTRLGRDVALKVLPPHLAGRPDRRARLQREARAISRLNHPNICSLFDIGNEGGVDFLVMEHIEGRSLAGILADGPLRPSAATSICLQIARGLEAAHRSGILHRDLKTANVQVTGDGTVKILDFGLAKTIPEPAGGTDPTGAPTAAPDLTREGSLLGSPPYLSPEQVRGKPVDRRCDIWAFGCILYETLTGARPFRGETVADTLAAILEREPDWSALPADLPAGVRGLLRRCLEKDPGQRLPEIAEARRVLEGAAAASPGTGPSKTGRAARIAWGLLALLVALAAGRLLLPWFSGGSPAPPPRPQLTQFTFATGVEEFPAWSPGGDRIAFSREIDGLRRIFIRSLEDGSETALTTGEFDEIQPAWSPDGKTLLFVRANRSGRKLEPGDVFATYSGGNVWSRDLASGDEAQLMEEAFHPAWSPDGSRIAVDASFALDARRIWLVDERGRNPVQLTVDPSEAVSHHRPRWSPDGERIVYQHVEKTEFDLRIVEVDTRRIRPVTDDPFRDLNPVWSRSGKSVYFTSNRGGGLNVWRIPVPARGSSPGRPEQVTTGPGQDVEIAMAPDGRRIAFSILKQNADLWQLPVSPDTGRTAGPPSEVIATTREDSRGAWSPDGTRIAFNSDRAGYMNIWIHDRPAGITRQLTEGPGGDYQPNWSPDARRIAFFSSRGGSLDIWTADLETGDLSNLTRSDSLDLNPFFSPDGRWIAYQSDQGGRLEVWLMAADGSDARPLTRIGTGGHFLRWTPDGRSVLFRSPHASPPGAYRVDLGGGEPRPLGDIAGGAHMSLFPGGRRVLDVTGHKTLWVSSLDGGAPVRIFEFDDPGTRIDYPVLSPDGSRALFDRFRPQGGDIWLLTVPERDGR